MPAWQPFDWYRVPIYYDIVFDTDTVVEAQFLSDVYQRHATSTGRCVLEPACGTGRLVTAMALRQFDVTGFDLSAPSLDFARQRLAAAGLRAELAKKTMERFTFQSKFDLAYCLVSTFKYLLSEHAATTHLQSISRCLRHGGIYALGFHLTDYHHRAKLRERWVAERDGTRVTCNIQSWPPDARARTEQVRARLLVNKPDGNAAYETSWQFRTYNVSQVRRLLAAVPELEHVATYNFTYNIDQPVTFDGSWLDNILILRRR